MRLQSSLTDLGHLTKRFKELVEFGLDQLRDSAVKARIKPSMESLLSCSHNLDEVSLIADSLSIHLSVCLSVHCVICWLGSLLL